MGRIGGGRNSSHGMKMARARTPTFFLTEEREKKNYNRRKKKLQRGFRSKSRRQCQKEKKRISALECLSLSIQFRAVAI